MELLRDTTRETVILGKRQRDRVVYLEVLEGPEVIRYSARPGDTKPLHSSCIGKAMLSALRPGEIGELLGDGLMPRVTPSTITDFDELLGDLAAGRERGFFMTQGENVADVTALAVPIGVNNELFGLAVAGPSHRVDARLGDIALALRAAQNELLEQGIAGHG